MSSCVDNLEFLESVARGGFSEVWKAKDASTGKFVAVKVVKHSQPDYETALWRKEINCLQRLRGEEIVSLQGFCQRESMGSTQHLVVLEWLAETLYSRISSGSYRFSPKSWLKLSQNLINAISRAHEMNIAHRDIKPQNILFRSENSEDLNIVLIDFGIGKDQSDEEVGLTAAQFWTPVFSPQDSAACSPFSRDVYSIAAVLTQLLGTTPVRETFELKNLLKEASNKRLVAQEHIDLLRACLHENPEQRPVNAIELRSQFDRITSKHTRRQTPARIKVYFRLTYNGRSKLDKYKTRTLDETEKVANQLLKDPNLTAKVNTLKEGKSPTLDLLSGNIGMRFVIVKDNDSGHHISLIDMRELSPEQAYLQRSSSKDVSGQFSFEFQRFASTIPVNAGIQALERALRTSPEKTPPTSGTPTSIFNVWRRALDLREEFELNDFEPLKFQGSVVSRGLVSFEIDGLPEKPLVETIWEIPSVNGVIFEVLSVADQKIWTKPSIPVNGLPTRGTLTPSLGRGKASFRRQRNALQSFIDNTCASTSLKNVLENPSNASSNPNGRSLSGNPSLDASKLRALRGSLDANEVFLVEGPPGTGKTAYIAELVKQITHEQPDTKILLVAQTHVAVDNALERIVESGMRNVLRIGDPSDTRISTRASEYLIDRAMADWAEQVKIAAESSLAEHASETGPGITALRTLETLSAILITRRTVSNLRDKIDSTSVLGETDLDSRGDRLMRAFMKLEYALENHRKTLLQLSPNIASQEPGWGDFELDNSLRNLADKFEKPQQLLSQLGIQQSWLLKFHTDDSLKSIFVKRATILAGTCTGFLRERATLEIDFDYVIVDEASKATSTEALVALERGRKAILVGDSRQLNPNDDSILRRTDLLEKYSITGSEVEQTLFARMQMLLPEGNQAFLNEQYRMSKDIGNLVSDCFYEGRLESTHDESLSGYRQIGLKVRWLDSGTRSNGTELRLPKQGFINRAEAEICVAEIKKLLDRIDKRHILTKAGRAPSILVVSPYSAQKLEIENKLRQNSIDPSRFRIETADAVQGTEADIVFVLTTRTNGLGFLAEPFWRRVNVAVSRARFALTIIGDAKFFRGQQSGFSKTLAYIEEHPDTCEIVEA